MTVHMRSEPNPLATMNRQLVELMGNNKPAAIVALVSMIALELFLIPHTPSGVGAVIVSGTLISVLSLAYQVGMVLEQAIPSALGRSLVTIAALANFVVLGLFLRKTLSNYPSLQTSVLLGVGIASLAIPVHIMTALDFRF